MDVSSLYHDPNKAGIEMDLPQLIDDVESRANMLLDSPEPVLSFLPTLDMLSSTLTFMYPVAGSAGRAAPRLKENVHKASKVFLKLLRRALKESQEMSPADPARVAYTAYDLQRHIAIEFGNYVSYDEIERLIGVQDEALKLCQSWLPPKFRREINLQKQIMVHEILPFLREMNPRSYRTAKVTGVRYQMMELLQLPCGKHIEDAEDACNYCGIKDVKLLKCSGVS